MHAASRLRARALRKLQPSSLEGDELRRPVACLCKSLARVRAATRLVMCVEHEATGRFNPRQPRGQERGQRQRRIGAFGEFCFDWAPTKRRQFPQGPRAMRCRRRPRAAILIYLRRAFQEQASRSSAY
jgi:hypothetical protein